MATITKRDLIDRVNKKTQVKHAFVRATVQNFLDEITAELAKNNRLEFRDFGVFEVRKHAPRTAHNPKTLEKIEVPAKRTVKFKMGRVMKERLKDGQG
ncbi:MAG: HU family DNA-binding protein [Planctomycetota bacterium]|jgi:nucleoid DNA-binding protein